MNRNNSWCLKGDVSESKNHQNKFTDFWPNFNQTTNYFLQLLGQKYDIKLSDRPDFLIYSVFGRKHRKYKCVKIFYSGENVRPNFDECDFAFSFDYLLGRHHYCLPLYALTLEDPNRLVNRNWIMKKSWRKRPNFAILFIPILVLSAETTFSASFPGIKRWTPVDDI